MDPVLSRSLKALENSRMFRIYRKNLYSLFLCQRHNDMACRHKGFLICQGNILSRLHGRYGRADTDHAYYSSHHNLSLRLTGCLHQAFHPAYHLHIQIPDPAFKLSGRLFFPEAGDFGMKFPYLLFQKLHIGTCRQRSDPNVLIVSCNFQCLSTDGTRRTQN